MVSAASLVACSKNERAFITALAEFEATKHHDFNGESCFVPSAVFVVWAANHKEEAPQTRTFRRAEELVRIPRRLSPFLFVY